MESQHESEAHDGSIGEQVIKKNIYPATEETSLVIEHEEEHDEPLQDSEIMIKSLSSSICDTRLPSYSISNSVHSSMNFNEISSVAFGDINSSMNMTENIQFAWDSIEEIRSKYLHDVRHQMDNFKHGLSLWNECGFIPLFTNFMSTIDDAKQEINRLMNRLSANTILIQRFVKLYKKQQTTLQIKTKQLNDVQFENNELKNENAWLRNQLLAISNSVSSSNEQIQSLNAKHNDTEQTFIEELEKLEHMEDKEEHIQNVTIFDTLSPKKGRYRSKSEQKSNMLSKSMHIPRGTFSARSSRSLSVRTSKSRAKSKSRKEVQQKIKKEPLKPFKTTGRKRSMAYSRSVRTAKVAKPKKPKLPQLSMQPKRKRFKRDITTKKVSKEAKVNPLNLSNISNVSCISTSSKENVAPNVTPIAPKMSRRQTMIPQPKSRTSSIRRPAASLRKHKSSASLRRMSYSAANNS